ncbi:hypothetical protein FFWV33_07195 [Flavobacterium faecale]|uniref:Lysine transporter LysE n=2 Tax=Flavobacterium faecale TaxID=1355330 RepID=A0A2S1LC99_9FLAO|nr:hypothetical protein FFWV33_07195 [Flavobacterium faecale]
MKILKNIAIGFTVSFLGSLPLGFLNVVGLEVYSTLGLQAVSWFILGIIAIECIVAYYTLIFANELVQNKKLMKWIDIFGIFFFLAIAVVFYEQGEATQEGGGYLQGYLNWPMFWFGVFLNCLNFLQIPFWLAWNLYFINGKFIVTDKALKFYYVGGTMVGVYVGMLSIIYFLDKISKQIAFVTEYLLPIVLPIFFLVMAVYQSYKVYQKYFSNKNQLEA